MNVLLVHGSMGSPYENWFPWLELELRKENVNCIVPTFPTPIGQDYATWKKLLDYYVDAKAITRDTILIGHSCGSVFLVHYLLESKIQVAGLICVSGYNNFISGNEFMDNLNNSFYIDNNSINVSEFANKVISYYGCDDPFIPQQYLSQFAKSVGGISIPISNAGHFNSQSGYNECKPVLDSVKDIISNHN